MSRNRTITYMVDKETTTVWSRVGNEVAIPVLDFAGMKPENCWEMNYDLEKMDSSVLYHANVIHTRKIPTGIKNIHRKFWGMKPIRE
jgi:hypothetical protein